jgi:phage shock protein E
MFEIIKKALGLGNSVDFNALIAEGAQIIDVRSKEEFTDGHIKGSVNIPLPIFANKLTSIQKDKPVIVCCASGARSSSAMRILISGGFQNVHNGGGWKGLKGKLAL